MNDLNLHYTPFETPSGIKVEVRGRTYAQWEEHEEARSAGMKRLAEAAAEGRVGGIDAEAFSAQKELRGKMLSCRVRDFATHKSALTLRDIAAIEKLAEKLEEEEVPEGNLESGGSGA